MSLASLTANYTDSEEEDQSEENEPSSVSSLAPGLLKPTPPGSGNVSGNVSNRSTPNQKISKLVSYNDEDDGDSANENSEEEDEEGGGGSVPMDLESPQEEEEEEKMEENSSEPLKETSEGKSNNKEDQGLKEDQGDDGGPHNTSSSGVSVEAWTEGIQLPPEPTGSCDPALQEKISKLMSRKASTGYDINAVIQQKKNFRNPSIYEKLIEYCEIDEHGTNLPKDLYDGHLFGKESYYEELAKVQKSEIERRDKIARHKKETAEAIFKRQQREATETAVALAANVVKRKSKWNQVPAGMTTTTAVLPPVVRPAPILVSASAAVAPPPPNVSKTIPAFGSLQKQ